MIDLSKYMVVKPDHMTQWGGKYYPFDFIYKLVMLDFEDDKESIRMAARQLMIEAKTFVVLGNLCETHFINSEGFLMAVQAAIIDMQFDANDEESLKFCLKFVNSVNNVMAKVDHIDCYNYNLRIFNHGDPIVARYVPIHIFKDSKFAYIDKGQKLIALYGHFDYEEKIGIKPTCSEEMMHKDYDNANDMIMRVMLETESSSDLPILMTIV